MKIDIAITKKLQNNINEGSQKAFEELYRLFFPRLYNFVLVFVHKKELAEELVNDVMIKIWEKRCLINNIENLETYLFVAVRNHSLNYLQKNSHVNVMIDTETGFAELTNLNNPEKELEWKEIHYNLVTAVDRLPKQCRTVFKLIKEEGFKYKQVAEILGLSPRTVETQLFRAIKKLSEVLNVHCKKYNDKKSSKLKNSNNSLRSL